MKLSRVEARKLLENCLFHKFQQFINLVWLQSAKNCNWKWKFATGNRN